MNSILQTYQFLNESSPSQLGQRNVQDLENNSLNHSIPFECPELGELLQIYFDQPKPITIDFAKNIKVFSKRWIEWEDRKKINKIINKIKSEYKHISFTELKYFTNLKTIKFSSFDFLKGISIDKIVFPDSLEVIEKFAMDDCTNLTEIHLPPNIKHVGEKALHCKVHPNLKIYIPETPKMIKFDYMPFGNLCIHRDSESFPVIYVPEKYWINYNNPNLQNRLFGSPSWDFITPDLEKYTPPNSSYQKKTPKSGTLGALPYYNFAELVLPFYDSETIDEFPSDLFDKLSLYQKGEEFCNLIERKSQYRIPSKFRQQQISYIIDNEAKIEKIWNETKNNPEDILKTINKILLDVPTHGCNPKLYKQTENSLIFNLNPKDQSNIQLFFFVFYSPDSTKETQVMKKLEPKLKQKMLKLKTARYKKAMIKRFKEMIKHPENFVD